MLATSRRLLRSTFQRMRPCGSTGQQPLASRGSQPQVRLFSAGNDNNDEEDENTKTTPPTAANSDLKSIAETLSETEVTGRVRRAAASAFLVGTGLGVALPVLPLFVQSMGGTATTLGIAMGVVGVTRLFLHGPANTLCEKYGRRPLLIGGAAVAAAGLALTGTASTVEEVYLWRGVFALGSALELTAMQLYLTDISTPENRASTLAPSSAAFSAGATFGPAVGGVLVDTFGHGGVPFFLVGGCVALTVVNNAFLPETLDEERKQQNKLAAATSKVQLGTLGAITQIKDNANVRAAVLSMTTFWATACGAVFAMVPIIGTTELEMSGSEVGLMFGAMSLLNVFGATYAAKVSDKYGRKVLMVPALAVAACAASIMPVTTSATAMGMAILLWGSAALVLGPTPTALVSESASDSARGPALAALRASGDIGLIVGPPLLGVVADNFGMPAAFWSGATCLATSSLLCLQTVKEVDRKGKKD